MENNESLFAGTFQLDDFQKALGYEFKDKGLLQKALTHSSYCSEHGLSGIQSNERLEFMGDGYLNAIIASELYRLMHDCAEGSLSRMRASIVCEKSLGEVGKKLKIGEYIKLGRGELKNGGRRKISITADAVESVIGAIFLDSGYEKAREFVLRQFSSLLERVMQGNFERDYKTLLQESLRAGRETRKIKYVLDRTEGPDHDKTFFVHVEFDGVKMGYGRGKSKKEAERNAAYQTLNGGYI